MKEKIDEKKYLSIALTVFAVIAASILLFFIIYRWKIIVGWFFKILNILMPILYGLLIAYILTPFVKFLEKKFFNKLGHKIFKKKAKYAITFSRIMSLLIAFLILFLLIFGFIYFVIPQIINSIDSLISNVPRYLNNIKSFFNETLKNHPEVKEIILGNINNISENFDEFLKRSSLPNMDTIVVNISNGIIGIIKTLYNTVLGIIIAIYLINGKEKFISQSKKILYSFVKTDRANMVLENLRHIHKVFGGFLIGKVIDSLIIGVICFIFMRILGMPYAVLISVIVGVTNIIPYFGPFIGAIPSALLILIVSPSKCITFIIFIFILQQFDGNILGPKILGGKTGLKSFWVLFAILVFGGLFGFVGMIFGVPLFAIIYAFINGICKRKLARDGLPINSQKYENVKEIDAKTKKPVYFQ